MKKTKNKYIKLVLSRDTMFETDNKDSLDSDEKLSRNCEEIFTNLMAEASGVAINMLPISNIKFGKNGEVLGVSFERKSTVKKAEYYGHYRKQLEVIVRVDDPRKDYVLNTLLYELPSSITAVIVGVPTLGTTMSDLVRRIKQEEIKIVSYDSANREVSISAFQSFFISVKITEKKMMEFKISCEEGRLRDALKKAEPARIFICDLIKGNDA